MDVKLSEDFKKREEVNIDILFLDWEVVIEFNSRLIQYARFEETGDMYVCLSLSIFIFARSLYLHLFFSIVFFALLNCKAVTGSFPSEAPKCGNRQEIAKEMIKSDTKRFEERVKFLFRFRAILGKLAFK